VITTGGKLWFAVTAFTLAAAVVYGVDSGGEWFGTLVLGTFAVAAAIIGFATVSTRDGDVDPDDTTADVAIRRALPAPWPALAALAMGFVVVGVATSSALLWLGLGLAAVTLAEWMVQSWAERATGDHAYNQALRNRIMFPFEFPVAAAVTVGFVVIGFSRVLLALPKTASWVIAAVIAASILAIATLITTRPRISSSVLAGVLAVGAVAVLGGGIVGAAVGERDFHEHEGSGETENPGSEGSNNAGGDQVEGGAEDDVVEGNSGDGTEANADEDAGQESEQGNEPQEQSENPDGGEPDPDDTTEVSAP
jgi:hypothetical protein